MDEFDEWFNSEETQRRFHCGQFSEEEIACAAWHEARERVEGKVAIVERDAVRECESLTSRYFSNDYAAMMIRKRYPQHFGGE